MPTTVSETFVSVPVRDMARATSFYVRALGATVAFATDRWTSIHIARVRLGLALADEGAGVPTGLHFAVADLDAAKAEIVAAGGRVPGESVEVAPGVVICDALDSEGNGFTLTRR
jgi:predicted enzyme related to lactoylglutathione lyase